MATARVERRLAAIVAADVAGYSRLMERDEAGTVARLKAIRKELVEPVLERQGGRFVDLKGDGAIVEFGSVVAAVEASVEIQRAMAEREAGVPEEERVRYRIGINLGEVVVDGADIYGDGVNVAARIESLCEPGGVWLAARVHEQVRGKLDVAFEPAGRHKVKNISEPVETWRVRLDGVPARRRPAGPRRPRWAMPAVAAAVLLVLMAAGGAWWLWPSPVAAGKPGIAVLPFDNMGGDEATGRLADGITEDIITDLARFRDLDVIARNSTAVYKGKAVDVRQVGRELGVRYVLEGSLQRQGDRVRVTTQLIDAVTGAHVWSERRDGPAEDVFAIQSEMAERVAASLGGDIAMAAIPASELRKVKRRPPTDLSAYDHYLLAAEAKGLRTKAGIAEGLEHAEKAIALDPTFARAYVARGWLRYFTANLGDDWPGWMERAAADFRKARELDPADATVQVGLGTYLAETGRLDEAAAEFGRALDQGPTDIHVLTTAASNFPYLGKPEEGVALADRGLRLDPHAPPTIRAAITHTYFYARRFERVIEVARDIPEESKGAFVRFALAASHGFLGQREAAGTAKAAFVAAHGTPSAELWLNQGYVFARSQERDVLVEGFRLLDLPVCATGEELKGIAKPASLPDCDAERAKALTTRS